MSSVLWVALIGVGAYVILGQVMQSQKSAAAAQCPGWHPAYIPVTGPTGCAAYDTARDNWAWYPQIHWA